jgi:transposase
VLTDIFGANGRRILDGLVARLQQADILASLSGHVRRKLAQLGDALGLQLREPERLLLADLLSEHDTLNRRIHDFDRHIDQAIAPWAESCRRLETLPGIDHTAACAILSEIGPDPAAVFGNRRRFAAWAGLCPGNNESAGKRRTGRIRPGNRTLRAVLVECAHAAARTHNCQFQEHHQRLTKKRGYKRAVIATAHKLLRCVFALLRDGTPYRDPETDYEALLVERNAARWLRKLHEFNVLVHNHDGTLSIRWPARHDRTVPVH